MPAEALEEYIAKYSNWGRWGSADEIGTVNLITRAVVRKATRRVEIGRVVQLSLPLDAGGPQTGAGGRFNCVRFSTATGTDHLAGKQTWLDSPLTHGFGFAEDTIVLPLHSGTHWDSLAHVFHRGRMYNGRSAAEVPAAGAAHSGAEKFSDKLVGRGVLLDLPAAQGVDWLEDGHAVSIDELEAAVDFGRLTIEEGDILLLRTGQLARCRRQGWGSYAGGPAPGLSFFTVPWLGEHGVAAVATDTWGVEVRPAELADSFQPMHLPALVYMGMPLGEIFDFDELALACAEAGRYEFFLSAPTLAITGASGAPPGPVAIL